MSELLQHGINGAAVGCIYGLVALGLTLFYKATEIVNFAQGDLLMLGAFVAFALMAWLGLGYWPAFALTLLALAVFGFLLDAVLLRRVLGQPQFAAVMLTIGIGFVLRSGVSMIPGWGVQTHSLSPPYGEANLAAFGIVLSHEHAALMAGSGILVAGLFVFFRYTRLGVAMQAVSQNQLASFCVGIPVTRLFSLVFALGAATAAAGGVLLAPISLIDVNMGFILLKAFPAAVLGGFGSIPGALVGGILIGVIEQFAGFYISSGAKNVAPYVVLLVVLAFWPGGLFGSSLKKKV